MDATVVITIICVLFIVTLLSGHYISTLLFACGMLGIYLLNGWGMLRGILTTTPYTSAASYTLSTIPLYILMAQFIMKAGIIQDLYDLCFRLSRGKGAVLGMFTIILGGVLGAVSGSGIASSAGLGRIAYPELRKRGYTEGLAGTICAVSGTLSPIIPPSISLILYGVTAQVSIASLFSAAVVPGLISIVVYCAVTGFFLRRDSKRYTAGTSEVQIDTHIVERSKKEKTITLIAGLIIIISIFGGIFSGKFTPTEAGAVAAFVAFLAALVTGKMTVRFFLDSLVDAVKTTSMALTMIIASAVFSRFLSVSLIPRRLTSSLAVLIARPVLLMFIVLVIYFILFMLMDGSAPILMTVPILVPIVQAAGFNLIWFGILVNIACCLGGMSPPVGMCTYSAAGVIGVKPSILFRYSTVYAIAGTVIVCGLLILFPDIATWLPNLLGN